jgi:putative CocE/NonD family hydrolase
MKHVAAKVLVVVACVIVLAARPMPATAQDFGFDAPADATDPALPAALRDLAERVVPVYSENHPERYLANLAALQLVAGDPAAARESRMSLQGRLRSEQGDVREGRAVAYDIYTEARAIEARDHVLFTSAYGQAFRETLERFDDLDVYELEPSFNTPLAPLRNKLQHALDERRGKTSITLDEALELVGDWFAFEAYRSFGDVARLLFAEEKQRRFATDEIAIPVAEGAKVAATLVRPHAATGATLPTLLEFTLDRSHRDAVEVAAHGYVSVLALSRMRGDPKMRPRAPFESEGDDARAVIEWIAKQPWSDGRVVMQGTGYGGFVAWSAAKRLPPALKAIATYDPMAPGISLPIANGIFQSSAYRWVSEMLVAPDKKVNDAARWRRIEEDWFRSGRPYREFATLPGRASAIFQSWLNHPSYDRFWQKWLPFGDEFARVDIPVLTVAGYYAGEESAALYYFTEHHQYDARAEHALLMGPFNDKSVEPQEARYAWFDYALRGAKRPALLAANVNYELAGANEWRHEPSLDTLERNARRFYLADAPNGAGNALVGDKPAAPLALTQTLDLRDRSDAEWRPTPDLVRKAWQPRDGALFVSEPFAEGMDLVGRLRGTLDFTINKYDVDLALQLYELRANGEYVKLFEPAYTFRASYARDRVHRQLLAAGVRQQLPFQSQRVMGHSLAAGSRLALAIAINKRADQQVNYGGDGDVSEESIDDAGAPVRIRWHEGSFIEVPAR